MEERRGGVCFILIATFLTLAAAQRSRQRGGAGGGSGALTFLTQPERVYYVSTNAPGNITCEVLGATGISFTCSESQVPPSSQITYESYDEARRQTLIRSSIEVTRNEIANHQRRMASSGRAREDYWCECVAEDIAGRTQQRSNRAIVRLAYMRKQFQEEPANQTVELGAPVVFRCIPPQGEPAPELTWRKDGRRVESDRDDNIVLGEDGRSLTLRSARTEDSGQYECAAKNDAARRVSEIATLTVKEARTEGPRVEQTTASSQGGADGIPVFLEKPPKTIYLKRDDTFPFTCHIQGTNRMTLRCNGQRVKTDSDKLSVVEDAASNTVRLVFSVTYADVENYINSFNEKVYRCECVAWYRSDQADRGWGFETSNTSDIYLASLEQQFEEEPRDVTVDEGQTATLVCQPPEGSPSPWVYWMFEQRKRLDPRSDPRYRVQEDGSLVIQQVQRSDQGRYYCVAENVAGTRNSRTAQLTISALTAATTEAFPEVISNRPVFTRDLESEYYLDVDGKATLVCSVVGAGQLTYHCNDARLSPDKQVIDRRIGPDGRSVLLTGRTTVTSDDVFDSPGEAYSCQCVAWYIDENNAWQTNVSNKAVVRVPYLDYKFRYDPKPSIVSVGQTARLSCQPPDGKPKPKVTWWKDGTVIKPDEDSNFIILDDFTLIVEYVRPEDAGEYMCIANNLAGERTSEPAQLKIDEESLTPTPEEDTTTKPTPPPTTTPHYTITPHRPSDGQTTTMMPLTTTSMAPMMGGERPIFSLIPDKQLFIIRNQAAVLRCGAIQVSSLQFYCNGQRVYSEDEDDDIQSVDPTPGLTSLEKSIEVQREDVDNYVGLKPYTCQCRAYYQTQDGAEDFLSSDTIIEVAFLKKKFELLPMGKTVREGERVELMCRPPEGKPEPMVEWLKTGVRLKESEKVHVTAEGSLVFEEIMVSDAGNYTCTAGNVVSTRYSDTVTIQVSPADGPIPNATDPDLGTPPTLSTTTLGAPEDDDETMSTPETGEDGQPETTPEGEPDQGEGSPEVTPESEVVVGEPVIEDKIMDETSNQVEVMGPGAGAGEMLPVFNAEPESLYYIIRSRPVVIFCQTRGAKRVTFSCNGDNLPQSRVHFQNNIAEGQQDVLMASIEISREEVENYLTQHGGMVEDDDDEDFDDDDDEEDNGVFYCQCHAQYTLPGMDEPQNLTSSKGYVEVAFLKRNFRQVPENVTVSIGDSVSLHCKPPEGNPAPETKWLKEEAEVYSDTSSPDKALVFSSVTAAHAGNYYCVASNLANVRRTPYPAVIEIKSAGSSAVLESGAPHHEGIAPEPGVEPDVDQDECVSILKGCSTSMPQTQRDQATSCQSLSVYLGCLDNFLQRCSSVMQEESVKSAQMARESAERVCSGQDVCPELNKCQSGYVRQVKPVHSAHTMPMLQLCRGIEDFLRCADTALMKCGMSSGDKSTTLLDVATWFQQYCARVTEGQWMERCDAMTQCEVPIQQASVLQRMLQVHLWCPQIHHMMGCTSDVAKSCNLKAKDDLEFLINLASVTCPQKPLEDGRDGNQPKVGDVKGDDAHDDDDDDDEEDDDDSAERNNELEPGKSTGQDDEDDDDNSGSWTIKASVLLTSLLSVLFAMTVCR